jgi:hypothetical protein
MLKSQMKFWMKLKLLLKHLQSNTFLKIDFKISKKVVWWLSWFQNKSKMQQKCNILEQYRTFLLKLAKNTSNGPIIKQTKFTNYCMMIIHLLKKWWKSQIQHSYWDLVVLAGSKIQIVWGLISMFWIVLRA